MNKTVFIDMETTHINTSLAQPMQIALVAVDIKTLDKIDELEIKIHFDELKADNSVLYMNGYDPAIWRQEAMRSTLAIRHITNFFERHATWDRISKSGNMHTTCEIAGHNIAGYDAPILSRWYREHGDFCPAATWITGPVDTMHMARNLDWLCGESPYAHGYSLSKLCERYGIKIENEHDAMCDITATVELAKALRNSMS